MHLTRERLRHKVRQDQNAHDIQTQPDVCPSKSQALLTSQTHQHNTDKIHLVISVYLMAMSGRSSAG